MHPLVLAGGAGLALLALARKKEGAPTTSGGAPSSPAPSAAAPSGGGGGAVPDVAAAVGALIPVVPAILGGGGAAGGSTAIAAGGAAAGTSAAATTTGVGNVTLVSGGAAGAGLVAGAVLVTAAGALAGSQLGQGTAFGGVGGAVMGGLNFGVGLTALGGAQIGRELHRLFGGDGQSFSASGLVAQLGSATTLGFVAVLGPAAAIGLGPLTLAVFGVVSAIEDAARLRHGQLGARGDWQADFNSGRDMFTAQLRKAAPSATNDDVLMFAHAAAHGWANEKNQQKYRIWSAKPWGLGQSAAGHAKWGFDRGYWLANPSSSTGSPTYFESPEFVNARTRASSSGMGTSFSNAIMAGGTAANIGNYQWAMKQPRGLGQSDIAHFTYWKKAGYFNGLLTGNGDLYFDGRNWSWK